MPNSKLKYFSKARVGNIMAAVVLIWTLWLWTDIIIMYSTVNGISDVALTILAMWNVIAGIAAKHLWDNCSGKD